MGNLTDAERERFRSKVVITSKGCWQWQGPLDKDGYGSFYLRRKGRRSHRVAWYDAHGEIPQGMVINHVCMNRACVNVQHLELVTIRDSNLRDTRSPAAINARKTHCPEGHEYDRIYAGQRYCSTCDAAKKKRLRARWRAEDTLRV